MKLKNLGILAKHLTRRYNHTKAKHRLVRVHRTAKLLEGTTRDQLFKNGPCGGILRFVSNANKLSYLTDLVFREIQNVTYEQCLRYKVCRWELEPMTYHFTRILTVT